MADVVFSLNPLDKNGQHNLSNNNLTDNIISDGRGNSQIRATVGKKTGKWYWEITQNDSRSTALVFGISTMGYPLTNPFYQNHSEARFYYTKNKTLYPSGIENYGTGVNDGDVVSILLDLDNGTLEFWKNGISLGVAFSDLGTMTGDMFPTFSTGAGGASEREMFTVNFGATPFKYSKPTGFKPYETFSINKVLIFNSSQYKIYNSASSSWQTATNAVPIAADFLNGNTLGELASIPESAWSQLTGNVEICYYTDDPRISEAQFNIETTPFTLAEEWEDKTIKIIEYTDNSNQTESMITLETEPFSLYDELGDTVDVLYYTDDPAKTSAELHITANYSPLDELDSDPELVTWTNEVGTDKTLRMASTPKEQMVLQSGEIDGLNGIIKASLLATSDMRMAVSVDKGATWKIWNGREWKILSPLNINSIKKKGMSSSTVNALTDLQWASLIGDTSSLQFAYYLKDPSSGADQISIRYKAAATSTPTLNSIKVSYDEITLEGRLQDLEKLNAINIAKLNFKSNALLTTDKYKLYDLVVDTFDTNTGVEASGTTATYDTINKRYNGVGDIVMPSEPIGSTCKKLIIISEATADAAYSYSMDDGSTWAAAMPNAVIDISEKTGSKLKVKVELPAAGSNITSLAYSWA